jgi:hypothetical protein
MTRAAVNRGILLALQYATWFLIGWMTGMFTCQHAHAADLEEAHRFESFDRERSVSTAVLTDGSPDEHAYVTSGGATYDLGPVGKRATVTVIEHAGEQPVIIIDRSDK